ncbi:hypothetical protein LGT39_01540 [Demequina sp. TTPB684]|uniref:hypothetical protein n=1 Tax=unclassified Demequina TaxID=2620311 RepID=UPI001CF17358|nr:MULTISPECIES: hypothetical protein [unclassified Demequina]MCB2411531.1 hypothetical protein [Demequina sp. TTPB684]UPU88085.1 hypothetical protein LGT36_012675 [Demequina sp. TMPB413]
MQFLQWVHVALGGARPERAWVSSPRVHSDEESETDTQVVVLAEGVLVHARLTSTGTLDSLHVLPLAEIASYEISAAAFSRELLFDERWALVPPSNLQLHLRNGRSLILSRDLFSERPGDLDAMIEAINACLRPVEPSRG